MSSEDGPQVGPAERLAAIEEISKLKSRYFRFMDTKRWADWQEVFAPDALMDMTGEAAAMRSIGFAIPEDVSFVWRSSDAIRAAVAGALEHVTSAHHGHMGEVELVSPAEARGVWAMEDLILYPAHAPVAGFRGYGHYFETYQQVGGAWRIQSIRLERLCVRPIPHPSA